MISFLNTFKRLQREKLISNRVRSSLFSSSTLRPLSMVKLIRGQPVSKCLSGLCRVHEKCVFKQEESSKCNLGRQTANKLSRGYGFPNSFPLYPRTLVPRTPQIDLARRLYWPPILKVKKVRTPKTIVLVQKLRRSVCRAAKSNF